MPGTEPDYSVLKMLVPKYVHSTPADSEQKKRPMNNKNNNTNRNDKLLR